MDRLSLVFCVAICLAASTAAAQSCGDGVVGLGEQCDLGGFNGAPGACCTAACQFSSSAVVCRSSAGPCDVAEACTGSSAACPGDSFASSITICRAAAGPCDIAESCTGASAACPADTKSVAECRAATGDCDLAEFCDGVNNTCPADAFVADGQACDDGSVCTTTDACQSGACVGSDPLSCEPCQTCDPSGGCTGPVCKPAPTSSASAVLLSVALLVLTGWFGVRRLRRP